jgi:hypothetical protein
MKNLSSFREPLALPRGTPFGSCNNSLNLVELLILIGIYKIMGLGSLRRT